MVPIFTHYLWGCWRMKSIVKGGGLMAGAALLLSGCGSLDGKREAGPMASPAPATTGVTDRSEEHTSELQSLMRISYAVFCLKKKKRKKNHDTTTHASLRTHESTKSKHT